MIATFAVIGLLARFFSSSGVGEFMLIRRSLYFLQPVILLGITVAVPRYLPMHPDPVERTHISAIGFWVVTIASLAAALVLFIQRPVFAQWIFGDTGQTPLVASLAVMSVAFGLHSYAYSYYRGLMHIRKANVLDAVNLALVPMVAVLLCARWDVAAVVLAIAVAMLAFTVLYCGDLWRKVIQSLRLGGDRAIARSLLTYGLPRIPGDLALAGLLFGAPLLLAHAADLHQVGRFSIAQTVLMLPGAALAPLSILLLPYVSARRADGDRQTIQRQAALLFHGLLDLSVFFALQMVAMADVVVVMWVGEGLADATPLVRLIMLAVPFYTIYFVFRSILDATTTFPVTAINLVLSFVVFVAFYFFFLQWQIVPTVSVTLGTVLAYMFLGLMTFVGFVAYYRPPSLIDGATLRMFLINIALAIAAYHAQSMVGESGLVSILIEFCAVAAFLAMLWRTRRDWIIAFVTKRSWS